MINKAGRKYLFLLMFILALPASELFAQFYIPCIDTIRQPNPYYYCDFVYQPVCGCNGVTYRNDCVAYWQNAVNLSDNGICGDIDVYLIQNLVSEYIEFAIYLKQFGYVSVAVYDVYGMMYYFDALPGFVENSGYMQVPVQNLRHGVYFFVIIHNEQAITRKFIRLPHY